MNVPFVDLRAQYCSIQNEIQCAIEAVVSENAFIGGKYVQSFERDFAAFCGVSHCVGVGNGTDALHVALRALGVGPGDEVITVANSFIATSEAITMTGAKVVFVDCNSETYTIDTRKILEVLTNRTKAIIPVHLYGCPADMDALRALSTKHNLFLVEDAAQAHGATINGTRVGCFGDAACFSFYPGKNLGAYGDAGAIVTNDESLARKCRMIANHGRIEKYDHDMEGINSRLDGLQAAILGTKLRYLNGWTENRRMIADRYKLFLQDTEIVLPKVFHGAAHAYHLFVVRVKDRDTVRKRLTAAGVETGVHYPIALPNLKAYSYLGYRPEDFPVATRFSSEVLSLPIYPEIRPEQVEYVCDITRSAIL